MKNLLESLWKNSTSKPENLAYRFLETGDITGPKVEINWLDLANRVKAIAATLQLQTQVGDRALLLYGPGIDFIAALYACFAAGVIAVPCYPPEVKRANRTLPRLQAIALDGHATIVLTNSDLLKIAEPLCVQANGLKHLKWIATDQISTNSKEWKEFSPKSDDIAYLQYTSGSTGDPKGVMVTHNNLIVFCSKFLEQTAYNPQTAHYVSWLPVFHDMGLIWGLMTPVVGGFPCTFMSPIAFLQKPSRWFEAISQFRATGSAAPNFAYDLSIRKTDEETLKKLDLSCLEFTLNGAEPVRAETITRFQKRFEPVGFRISAMCPAFGLAENTLQVTIKPPTTGQPTVLNISKKALEQNQVLFTTDEDSVKIVSCGLVTELCDISIVNPDTFTKVSTGHVGEVWLSGPLVTKGYWQRTELNKEIFEAHTTDDSNNWLRTGDLGFIYNNELFITGRLKDLIIIRGRNIYPQDIEKKVEEAHQAIRLGCVAAFPIEINQEETVAIIAEVDSKNLNNNTINQVLSSLQSAIVKEFEIEVHKIVLIEQGTIYKTSSGKIQRKTCRKALLESSLKQVATWTLENQSISNIETNKKTNNLSPAKQSSSFALNLEENKNTKNIFEKSFLEQWVKEWISKKTGLIVEDIEMEREFSCYNIDSVAGVTMVQELEDLLGFSLSSTMIWDYPNPNKVVDYIINQLKPSKDTQTTSNKDLEKPKITNKLDSLFEQIENLSEQEAYELISKQ